MQVLLDTHVLLWWLTDDERLSHAVRRVIAEPANEILVSAASAWELSTKYRLGRLRGCEEIVVRYTEIIEAEHFRTLAIEPRHALLAGTYATRHRDPFDRMLAAQSELESLPLATDDEAFRSFPCRTLW